MEKKTITITPGELIVGEKGPRPKAAPTYPELCCHTLEDLEILDSREKTSFAVSDEARRIYRDTIIPFWEGRSMRDRIFSEMTGAWKAAYGAGVFTEFMEQRSPGHTVLDDKIYQKGMLDFKREIEQTLRSLDYLADPEAYDKQEELKAMAICADGLVRFAERHADLALELADEESEPDQEAELKRIAAICRRVPAHGPRDFWEALQYYWFVHLGVTTELNPWDAFCPGHLDQHLYPFYRRGLAEGTLTPEKAEELLQCLWIKFDNQPAPPKVGVTAEESGTYTDFVQVNLGGLKEDGSDGSNDLSHMMLDVITAMHQVQPNPSVQISKRSPRRFLDHACRVIREGMGKPDVFNCDLVIQELVRQGKSIEDARAGGTSGCVEAGAFGKESYILTGYFNMPKVLEITLNDGVDPRTGEVLGLSTGDPTTFETYGELFDAYRKQLRYLIDVKVRGNNVIERLYARYLPAPFLSLLMDDCIANGKDYHDGGTRYNTNYIQGVGLATVSDALSAIKYHVYDEETVSFGELLRALQQNFRDSERVRQQLLNRTPRYGNDDDYADSVMVDAFEAYFDAVDGRPTPRGGTYRVNLLPTTVHIYFGSVVGATPDGRKAGSPLSEGISPVQGADRNGPTAVIKSVTKMDHARTGGTLFNQKFTPQVLESEDGLRKLGQLIRTYFNLDGHHIQFNVVDTETLRAAQQNPDEYRDLIVRVAGYSDYFCDLSRDLQDEIIARTAHEGF
jgi:formate C-acetyltransferase